jgi:hypothetical protein
VSEPAGVRQEAAAITGQKTLDEEILNMTSSSQAIVGEEIIDENSADKSTLEQKPAETEILVEAAVAGYFLDFSVDGNLTVGRSFSNGSLRWRPQDEAGQSSPWRGILRRPILFSKDWA